MRQKIILSAIAMLAVIALPLLVYGATTKYTSLNVTDYIKNSTGALKLDDNVKVSDNLNVKGIIKNTTSGTAVTVDDDFKVNGNISLNDLATVDGVDISTLSNLTSAISPSTACTEGQILKYNAVNNTWDCSTDLATITESTMTIGSGLSLSDTGALSVSGVTTDMIVDATIASTDIAADAIGADQLSSGAISAGDVEIGDLPAGGNWALSSNLNVDDSTLIIDTANNRVGIGAAPRSALFVPDGSYAQFANSANSEPSVEDCDQASEVGRIFIDYDAQVLLICTGAKGWAFVVLTDLGGGGEPS